MVIGYIEIDMKEYIAWHKEHGLLWSDTVWSEELFEIQEDARVAGVSVSDVHMRFSRGLTVSEHDKEDEEALSAKKARFVTRCASYLEQLSDAIQYYSSIDQPVPVVYETTCCYFIELGDVQYLLPKGQMVRFTPLVDYSAKLFNSADSESSELSIVSADMSMDEIKADEVALKQTESDIKEGKVAELEELQKQFEAVQNELERKKANLLAELEKKQEELNSKKKELELKIENLEFQIYCIRCFTGEVVHFTKLRDGNTCDINTPIIVYQKLRYLDEELGRFDALYDLEGSTEELKYVEQYIAQNGDFLDMLCPSDKCITLVKISRSNKIMGYSPTYANVLTAYKKYHGDKIGILIRDKEQLYMTWVDDDKIQLEDDVFYIPSTEIHVTDGTDKTQMSQKNHMLSRVYIFNILQGCISPNSNSNGIINLPEGVSFLSPTKYIVFSSADGWIDYDKYGDLSDLISECNSKSKVGDTVITTLLLRADSYSYYSNDRGRGEANRTRGCHVPNNFVTTINLIDHEDSKLTYKLPGTDEEHTFYFSHNDTVNSKLEDVKAWCLRTNHQFDPSSITYSIRNNIYISVLKDDSDYVFTEDGRMKDRERDYRVNFEVYNSEFLNIECMNSAWLEYFISSKKVQNVKIGGSCVDYAYLILYLNTALKEVLDREQGELKLLVEAGFDASSDIDWRHRLSLYKLTTGRHKLNRRWAKHFVNTLRTSPN